MAVITPTKSDDNKHIVWENLTNGDTAAAVQIASGKHTVQVKGTHDSEVVDLHHGDASDNLDAIDTTAAPAGLRFTFDSVSNLEIHGGWVAPVFSTAGGGSEDLTVKISKID